MSRRGAILLCAWALLAASCPASALSVRTDIGFDQRIGSTLPLGLKFRDETGFERELGSFFHGKPMLLSLAYYRCPNLCTLVLTGAVDAMRELHARLGSDYEALTVSIHPRESARLALAKQRSYLARYGRAGGAGWHFLTGDAASIRELARSVGFRYSYDKSSGEYAHPSGIIVVTPRGRISRYFFGIRFPAGELDQAIAAASRGSLGRLAEAVLLFCFHYDPATGRYGLEIIHALQVAGCATALGLGLLLIRLFRREARA